MHSTLRKKIFIIDSDPDNLEIITYILTERGYEILIPYSDNLLFDITSTKPDLILMDDWSEEMLVEDLCMEVKSNNQSQHIPILLFSTTNDLHLLASRCNADGFIKKPFNLEDLEQIVKKFLKAR